MTQQFTYKEKEPVFATPAARQSAYKELFLLNPLGKKIFEDLMSEFGMHRTAYNAKNSSQTDFNLGKQHCGYHIINTMKINLVEVINE